MPNIDNMVEFASKLWKEYKWGGAAAADAYAHNNGTTLDNINFALQTSAIATGYTSENFYGAAAAITVGEAAMNIGVVAFAKHWEEAKGSNDLTKWGPVAADGATILGDILIVTSAIVRQSAGPDPDPVSKAELEATARTINGWGDLLTVGGLAANNIGGITDFTSTTWNYLKYTALGFPSTNPNPAALPVSTSINADINAGFDWLKSAISNYGLGSFTDPTSIFTNTLNDLTNNCTLPVATPNFAVSVTSDNKVSVSADNASGTPTPVSTSDIQFAPDGTPTFNSYDQTDPAKLLSSQTFNPDGGKSQTSYDAQGKTTETFTAQDQQTSTTREDNNGNTETQILDPTTGTVIQRISFSDVTG
jgi:YD repeat-containing protein